VSQGRTAVEIEWEKKISSTRFSAIKNPPNILFEGIADNRIPTGDHIAMARSFAIF
jgi:hypothetical protein